MLINIFAILFFQVFSPWNYCVSVNTVKSSALLDPAKTNELLTMLKNKSLAERIDFWSDFFKNVPYGIDPSGEGDGIDDDPIFDPCVVDCETYVEQTLALSFSSKHEDISKWLKLMRYKDGIPSVRNKYYTMALSWFPGNLKLGYLSEISLTKKTYEMKRRVFPEGRWKSVHKRRFALMGENAPEGTAVVRYVPIDILLDKYRQIKTPAVAFIVRTKQAGNPFLITHMGFILKNKKGKMIFRHASKTPGRRKVEERKLLNYLRMLKKYFNNPRKPRRFVAGMAIYSVTFPTRR